MLMSLPACAAATAVEVMRSVARQSVDVTRVLIPSLFFLIA
jgi:hypothetical protein